jgi:hypothetical protein
MKNSKKELKTSWPNIVISVILVVYVGLLTSLGYAVYWTHHPVAVPAPAPQITFDLQELPLITPDIIAEQPILDPMVHSRNEEHMNYLKWLVEEEVRELEKKFNKK